MGVAEVIPGISGGTLALILGVYKQLINSINSFDMNLLRILSERKILEAWKHIDGSFLLILFVGMLISIVSLASLILYIMDVYPVVFKSFLSAILFGSVFLEPLKPKISKPFILGLMISFIICSLLYLMPTKEMSDISLWYLFFSGFIAITALVVPGISGSFILLLLGSYSSILIALRDFDVAILSIFLFGAFLGLFSVVRVIKLLYAKNEKLLMAVFFGLIIFCIPLIWTNKTSSTILDLSITSVLSGIFLGLSLIVLVQKLRTG